MADTDTRTLDTPTLAGRCADETQRYFRHLPHNEVFCFELFRRAIVESEWAARESINRVYAPLLKSWVAHSAPKLDDEEQTFVVSEETDRFWSNFSTEKFKRALHVAQILKYWEICVTRSARKFWRKTSQDVPIDPIVPGQEPVEPSPPIPDIVDERVRRLEFWKFVLSHCQDEVDRLLAHRMIVEDMPPSEVYALQPSDFANIQDVYRRVRNLTDRWKRDSRLKRLWEDSQ